jgi:hypothetical protein
MCLCNLNKYFLYSIDPRSSIVLQRKQLFQIDHATEWVLTLLVFLFGSIEIFMVNNCDHRQLTSHTGTI